ncbi:recombinase family protein [Clostridium perfringens]|jgi:DNA invertase Pin-like site-specific DNA recombinase|uniref:recombinase family protein n=1 Tax=Clostridium perfringens TaxID=1502 RepID=UPI0018AB9099|nr:recombinase family protein [Clostridium perfringens]MBI6057660.1 recombinase family protein [Clostridium perfringens]MDB2070329.1 recombinase family protein [Clostridium perfringens]MDJ8945295.1 recombinase family protein [Clostridium perfringens]MDK0704646.1 recombinase family protein [Clostridium perfringens]MDK0817849.1 recombinase family protein [Clostridium perfringens]
MIVKYLRVSTTGQANIRQDYQLDKLGIKFDRSYEDKITGKTKDRPQLQKMMFETKEGDTVYCESISRLGRNLRDLIEIIDTLVNKGVRVIVIKEGIDTNASTYKLLLAIFGGIAEMERETIQERTQQAVDALKEIKDNTGEIKTKSGKWFGREEKTVEDLPKSFEKYYKKMQDGIISKVEMAKLLGCGRATLYRWIKLYEGG